MHDFNKVTDILVNSDRRKIIIDNIIISYTLSRCPYIIIFDITIIYFSIQAQNLPTLNIIGMYNRKCVPIELSMIHISIYYCVAFASLQIYRIDLKHFLLTIKSKYLFCKNQICIDLLEFF